MICDDRRNPDRPGTASVDRRRRPNPGEHPGRCLSPHRRRRSQTVRTADTRAAVVAARCSSGCRRRGPCDWGVFWHQNQKVATATQVSISQDVADIGGIRFPVPPGWDVAVTKSDAKAFHVCVSINPAPDCDGIQMDIAVPGWFGNTDILPSGRLPMFDQCPAGVTGGHIIMTDDHNPIEVAGRPGIHYWGYCGNSSAVSHLWQLDDLSLLIYSPPGRYAAQISAIVAGLNLTQWAHHQGPQAAFFTSGSTAPRTR